MDLTTNYGPPKIIFPNLRIMLVFKLIFFSFKVTEADGQWTIKTSTIMKSMELSFKVGEQFSETTPDGREVDSIVTVDGNKFVCVQTAKKEGEKSTKSIRDFNDEGCVLTMEVTGTDVVCVQTFKRL